MNLGKINRLLVVGYGSIGKRHLKLARQFFINSEIWVLRHQLNNEIPEYSDGCFYNINDALLYQPQIAIIAGPASYHIEAAIRLAEKGVHLLIEKPLSDSISGVSELIKTCKKNNVTLAVGYNLRFLPSLQFYRNTIKSGIIGRTLSVRCECGQNLLSWRTQSDYRKNVSARKDLGGGVLLELSHEIDYLRWIFGEAEFVKATISKQSNLEIDVEDTAHLIINFKSENNETNLIGSLNIDFIRHDTIRQCIAIGENGTLIWNCLSSKVTLIESNNRRRKVLFKNFTRTDYEDTYFSEWKDFISCIQNKKNPEVSGYDGLKVLEIIDAARKSNDLDGRAVKVKNII